MKWVQVRSRAVTSEWGCIEVDQQCRGSNGKAKIEGYISVSDEEAHHCSMWSTIVIAVMDLPAAQHSSQLAGHSANCTVCKCCQRVESITIIGSYKKFVNMQKNGGTWQPWSYLDISQSQGTDNQVIGITAIFIRLMMKEVSSYGTSAYNKTPYHMSALMGEMWVLELLHGHLEWIWNELGVHKHVFLSLCSNLWQYGRQDSKSVTLEEQLAIFLYTCITGLSIWHVSKWFQHVMDTTFQ